MATLSEIIAKRQSMGPDATNVEARQALMGAPAVPATPIAHTVNVQQQMAGKTVEERQAIRNGQPATTATTTPLATPTPIVNAPVDPTTGLSKPLEATPAPITPVSEVKAPEPINPTNPVKTEPTVDYNVSAGREGEIQDNVAKITQTNPNLLKDRNAYNQAFGYETADAGKKALLDSTFSGQVKPSQDDIFNSMRAGVTVGDPKSTEYRQAQARINTFKKYSVYDTASLATSLQSGDLLVGTKAYNDLVSDPAMSAKIQKAHAFNKGVVDLAKIGETQTANIFASNPTVANAVSDGYMSKDEYNQLTNNAEVSAQGKLVEKNKTKYETIKAQYDAVEDDVDKEFTGKEVTDSFKAKVAADRRKGMYKDYQIASLEYQNSLGTYTNLKDDATALLEQNMKLYETAQAEKAQLAQEERQMKNSLALSQAQFDQKIAQQAQLMNDPATAIQSVIDEYKKLGIPSTSTVQSRLAEFQNSGLSLPDYLTKMGQNIQQSPAYQQYQKLQQGQLSDREKFNMQTAVENQRDTRNFAQQKELAQFNNDLNRQEFLFKIENDPEKRAKALALENSLASNKSLFDVLGKNVGTYEGNRGYDLAGAMGDPLPAGGNWKVISTDNAGEQVGSIFIGGKGKKPYGNTVVMEDENGNQIRYSHLQDIGVKQGDILGFGDIVGTRGNTGNVKGANGETLRAEQLKAGRGAHLDVEIKSKGTDGTLKLLSNADQVNFLKGLKSTPTLSSTDTRVFNSLTPSEKSKKQNDPKYISFVEKQNEVYNNPDASIQDILTYSAGGDNIGETSIQQLSKFNQALSQVDNLKKSLSDQTTGPIIGTLRSYNPYDSNAQALKAELNSLIPNIARGVYGEVGVLTDADIENYKKTIPNIQSTEDTNKLVFAMTLNTMLNGYKGQLQTLAGAGKDVSKMQGKYKEYETKINNLLNSIGGGTQSNKAPVSTGLTGKDLFSEWSNFNK